MSVDWAAVKMQIAALERRVKRPCVVRVVHTTPSVDHKKCALKVPVRTSVLHGPIVKTIYSVHLQGYVFHVLKMHIVRMDLYVHKIHVHAPRAKSVLKVSVLTSHVIQRIVHNVGYSVYMVHVTILSVSSLLPPYF